MKDQIKLRQYMIERCSPTEDFYLGRDLKIPNRCPSLLKRMIRLVSRRIKHVHRHLIARFKCAFAFFIPFQNLLSTPPLGWINIFRISYVSNVGNEFRIFISFEPPSNPMNSLTFIFSKSGWFTELVPAASPEIHASLKAEILLQSSTLQRSKYLSTPTDRFPDVRRIRS